MNSASEMEELSLPKDYSLGRITAYPPGEHEHPQQMEAQGMIEVPKGANLFLDVSQEVCSDLSKIHLVPKRLLMNGISLSDKNLDGADFTQLIPFRLRCLAIHSCNRLDIEQVHHLGRLESLEHLAISQTPLNAAEFSWILQFPKLKTLTLSGLGVDDSCLVPILDLGYLEELNLSDSKISDRAIQSIWKIPTLRGVNLTRCAVGDRSLEGIGSCSSLRSLKVAHTRISDQGIETMVAEALQNAQKLTSLSLRSCPITDKALVRLASLQELILLDVYDTEISRDGAAFLKRSMPGCRIFAGSRKGGKKLWRVDQI